MIFKTFKISSLLIVCLLAFSCAKKQTTQTSEPTRSSSGNQQANGQNGRQGGGQQGGQPSTNQLFTQFDSNNDGKLSKPEVKGPLQNDFDSIDLNNDGFITKTELNNAPKPQRR